MQRMIRARQLIRRGMSLETIARDVGFTKHHKFAQKLKRFYQLGPVEMVNSERKKCDDPLSFRQSDAGSNGP